MVPLRTFLSYYIRNALPFGTGLAFGIFILRADYAWYWLALAGIVLVVIGPLAIQFLLTLVVEALHGLPNDDGRPAAGGPRSALRGLRGPRVGSRGR